MKLSPPLHGLLFLLLLLLLQPSSLFCRAQGATNSTDATAFSTAGGASLTAEEKAKIDANRAAAKAAMYANGEIAYCEGDGEEASIDIDTATFVEEQRLTEIGEPQLKPVVFGFMEDESYEIDQAWLEEYGKGVLYYVLPGLALFLITVLVCLGCCCSRICCSRICCKPRHPLNEYKCGAKARPEACFVVFATLVFVSAVVGVVAFRDIGRGLKLVGCDTENFLEDTTDFLTGLNDELQAITSGGTAALDGVSGAFSTGVADITSERVALMASLNAFVDYTNTMTVAGEPAEYDLGSAGLVSATEAALDATIGTLTALQTTVNDNLVEPRALLMSTAEDAQEATDSTVATISDMQDQLAYNVIQVPEIPVLQGIMYSKSSYNGLNELLTDVEAHADWFGAVLFADLFVALPFLFFGLLFMHCKLREYRCCRPCGLNAPVVVGRCGCLCLFMGMLFCFLVSSIFFGVSVVLTDTCMVIDDFNADTSVYTSKIVMQAAQANDVGMGQLLDEANGDAALGDNLGSGGANLPPVGTGAGIMDGVRGRRRLQSGPGPFAGNDPSNVGGGTDAVAGADTGAGMGMGPGAATLSERVHPGIALDACFNDVNLMDALGLGSYFDDLMGDDFETTKADVKSMDVAGQFQSQEYADFNAEVTGLTPAQFGLDPNYYTPIHYACENDDKFTEAARAASDAGFPLASGEESSAAQCDTVPARAGIEALCITIRGKICEARNSFAKANAGCTDPAMTTQLACVGGWDHDKDPSTATRPREWISDSATANIDEIQARWAVVDADYAALQASAEALKLKLVNENDGDGDGVADGAITQIDPILERIRGFKEFTYCSFVKTQFNNLDHAVCGRVRSGFTNTGICMILAAFFGFFVIDAMFFVEIRIGGVGQDSHPLLRHPTFRIDDGPRSPGKLNRKRSQGRVGGLGGGGNRAAKAANEAKENGDIEVGRIRIPRQRSLDAGNIAVAVPINGNDPWVNVDAAGAGAGMPAAQAQPMRSRFDPEAIRAAAAGAGPENVANAIPGTPGTMQGSM